MTGMRIARRAGWPAAAALTLALASAAHGKGRPAPTPPAPATPTPGGPERLVTKAYPGARWKRITDATLNGGWIHVSIPAGQAARTHADSLIDQGYPWFAGRDPVLFAKTSIVKPYARGCDDPHVTGPFAMQEGGLRVAYGQVRCAPQPGGAAGLAVFYKVISGDAALYAIIRTFRPPASADAAALAKAEGVADAYLAGQVYLCGGRSTDARCGK
jgi:hypothetical protein